MPAGHSPIAASVPALTAWWLGSLLFAVPLGLSPALSAQIAPSLQPPLDAMVSPHRDDPANDAIIVVRQNFTEALEGLQQIVLSAETWDKLNRQIAMLKARLQAEAPRVPSICLIDAQLRGPAERRVCQLTLTYRVRTSQANQLVTLGCRNTPVESIQVDDQTNPDVRVQDQEYQARLDEPGEHSIVVKLQRKLRSGGQLGSEVGFDLALPGCPITKFRQNPIPEVTQVRIGTRQLRPPPLDIDTSASLETGVSYQRVPMAQLRPRDRDSGYALGPVEYLEVLWIRPTPHLDRQRSANASADIQVRVDETRIETQAIVQLSGSSKQWRIWAPADAEVQFKASPGSTNLNVPPADSPSPLPVQPTITRPNNPDQPIWTVEFPEAMTTPVQLVFSTNTPHQLGKTNRYPVGPFAVLDVLPQSGSLEVLAPARLRLTFHLAEEVREKDSALALESTVEADFPEANDAPLSDNKTRFGYSVVPQQEGIPVPPLHFSIRRVPDYLFSRTEHELRHSKQGWKLRSDILVTPIRRSVEELEFRLPSELDNVAVSTPQIPGRNEWVTSVRAANNARRIRVQLVPPRSEPFTLRLTGGYRLPLNAQDATLLLPQPLGTTPQADQVHVILPESSGLQGTASPVPQGDSTGWETRLRERVIPEEAPNRVYTAELAGMAGELRLRWRPRQAKLFSQAIVDVYLRDRQAVIDTHISLPDVESLLGPLTLQSTSSKQLVRSLIGAQTVPIGAGRWQVTPEKYDDGQFAVEVRTTVPIPRAAQTARDLQPVDLDIPLLRLAEATHGTTHVRVWREQGGILQAYLPEVAPSPWEVQPIELLPQQSTLPVLVLRASGLDLPLRLQLMPIDRASLAPIWIDRSLVQVVAQENGIQTYRIRFRIRQWHRRALEINLPAPPALRSLSMTLNGAQKEDWEYRERATGASRRTLRIPLNVESTGNPLILELRYQLLPGRDTDNAFSRLSRWDIVFMPPQPRGHVFLEKVRWQIVLPRSWVPLYLGSAIRFAQQLRIQADQLHSTGLYSTQELDNWFVDGLETNADVPLLELQTRSGDRGPATLTGESIQFVEFRLIAIPQPVWFILCSMLGFVLGLGLWRLPNWLFWVGITLLGCFVAFGVLGWPQLMGQVLIGGLPGIVLLAGALLLHWLLYRRYRRRLMHIPGFTRQVPPSNTGSGSHARSNRDLPPLDPAPPPDVWAPPHQEAAPSESPSSRA